MNKKLIYYSILAVLFIVSCKKKDDDSSSTTTTTSSTSTTSAAAITVSSDPVFRGTINGQLYYMSTSSGHEGGTMSDKELRTIDRGLSTALYSSYIKQTDETKGIFIEKGVISFSGVRPTDENFRAFFAAGTIPFVTQASMNGMSITWKNGADYWYTNNGDQTGSTFKIDEVVATNFGVKVKASFSCKLYSADSSTSITVTNGEYVGEFENN